MRASHMLRSPASPSRTPSLPYERAVTAQNDTPLSTVAFLLADETHQEKNPFLTVHQPIGAVMLDLWVHAHTALSRPSQKADTLVAMSSCEVCTVPSVVRLERVRCTLP